MPESNEPSVGGHGSERDGQHGRSHGVVQYIAEIGASHGGNVETALRLVEAAANAGATCVKGQIGIATLAAETSPLYDAFQNLELGENDWVRIAEECANQGVGFTASPWSVEALAFLVSLDPRPPFIKVGSGDLTYEPMLKAIAATALPVCLSTGMATEAEIRAALVALGRSLYAGSRFDSISACTVDYPAAVEDSHVARMRRLREIGFEYAEHGMDIGYSSHSYDWRVPFYAKQCGADVIEMHLTLDDRSMREQGALTPELFSLVTETKVTDADDEYPSPKSMQLQMLGSSALGVHECERKWLPLARRNPETGVRA